MKFKVYADVDYVMGHLRYGHLEGTIECESVEKLEELFKDKYFYRNLEIVVDDYSVEDYGDIGEYEYELIDETTDVDIVNENYVSLGAYEQAMWERDTAIRQLESYGVGFGEKAEMQRVRHGKWVSEEDKSMMAAWERCSDCGFCTVDMNLNYCPNCGCKMDGE